MKVAVGSENPVKLAAVREAFQAVWPETSWEVEAVKVGSGVSKQPLSDEEAIRGARNRAQRAREQSQADYGVGLEGGLQKIGDHYFDCGWIVVVTRQGHEGIGSSIKILTPPKMVSLIEQGMELGEANDVVFQRTNSKQAEGHFGLMTNNRITRAQGYRDGVVSALARFLHPELFGR